MHERSASAPIAARRAGLTRGLWCLALLAAGAACLAQTAPDTDARFTTAPGTDVRFTAAPGLVIGGSYDLPGGSILRGDLNAIGAAVTVAPGATLEGRLVAVGGTTSIDGTVTGDVHAYGGALSLGAHAVVEGDVTTDYAAFEQAAGAVVRGSLSQGTEAPFDFRLPTYVRSPVAAAARAAMPRDPLDMLFRAVALGLLAMLVVALAPARVTRVREAMVRRPVRMGFDGLLTAIVATLLLVLLAVTLIGIPLTILGGLLLYASVLFGWIAFGDAIGGYLADALQQDWSRAVRVAVGGFALALAAAALEYVPVLGGLAALVLSVVALGAVRSTRYGGREPRTREQGTPPAAAPQG